MKVAEYINETVDIRELYYEITGRKPGTGKIMCCMHDNKNTPAAKIYGNNLKCFGVCNCVYTPYLLMKRFFPERIKEIKASFVLSDSEHKSLRKTLSIKSINRNLPLKEVLNFILE